MISNDLETVRVEEEKCVSCGKPPDVEVTPTFHPLTARGERAYEALAKSSTDNRVPFCLDCLLRVGRATADGSFSEP